MHPGQSIPNVGRRARGHRASTFTLKGSGVSNTTTTTTIATTTASVDTQQHHPQPSESGDVNSNKNDDPKNSDVREKRVEERVGGKMDGDGEEDFTIYYHQHHHPHHLPHHNPYVRIPHRLSRSQRMSKDDDHQPNPGDLCQQDNHLQSSPRATTRASRHLSHHKEPNHQHDQAQPSPRATTRTHHRHPRPHPNRSPRNKAQKGHDPKTNNSQLRWQGSRSVRRISALENHAEQLLLKEKLSNHKRSKVDFSGGCLTGKNPAGHAGEDDALSDMPDTTRSEPGDVLKASREATSTLTSKLPQVVRNNTEPLNELLDYFWIYQGMGRQVLNLDLPREVWDKKLFRKQAKLPPINIPQERPTGANGVEGSDFQTGQDTQRSDNVSTGRRALSEPPCWNSPRSPHPFPDRAGPEMASVGWGRRVMSLNKAGETRDRKSSVLSKMTQGQGADTHSKKTLVVRMPVMTKDPTRADLLDNE